MNPAPVQAAMVEDRPEKAAMRDLWADYVFEASENDHEAENPWYLTLPGAKAKDIVRLVERGLISLTEIGAINERDARKVTAIEADRFALDSVRDLIPGVRAGSLGELLRGPGSMVYPGPKERQGFRAHVVNLDFNRSLQLDERLQAKELSYVDKIAEMHLDPDPMDWVLCLTFSAAVTWTRKTSRALCSWLTDNFDSNEGFAMTARALLNDELFDSVRGARGTDLSRLNAPARQRLLMAVIPKTVIQRQTARGWSITTEHSLLYGNDQTTHPMVSFVMRFSYDENVLTHPGAAYAASLSSSLNATAQLHDDGSIGPLSQQA